MPGARPFGPIPADTDYFGQPTSGWSTTEWMLMGFSSSSDEGVRIDDETMEDENGKFGWCWDSWAARSSSGSRTG